MLALLDLDPNVVKPGWTPLLITIALAAVMVLLFFSLRKQFKRIDVSKFQPPAAASPEADAGPQQGVPPVSIPPGPAPKV